MRINPLPGGAEAEGFGVGVVREEPTPGAARLLSVHATLSQEGILRSNQTLMQNSGNNSTHV